MKQFLLLQVYMEAQITGSFKNLQPMCLEPQLPWRKVPATVIVKAHKRERNPKLKLCQILGDKPLYRFMTRAI